MFRKKQVIIRVLIVLAVVLMAGGAERVMAEAATPAKSGTYPLQDHGAVSGLLSSDIIGIEISADIDRVIWDLGNDGGADNTTPLSKGDGGSLVVLPQLSIFCAFNEMIDARLTAKYFAASDDGAEMSGLRVGIGTKVRLVELEDFEPYITANLGMCFGMSAEADDESGARVNPDIDNALSIYLGTGVDYILDDHIAIGLGVHYEQQLGDTDAEAYEFGFRTFGLGIKLTRVF